MQSIEWPTERHQGLAEHILRVCSGSSIGVRLKGSIARGNPTRYSDLDITIYGRITRSIVERIVFGFEEPLMVNGSENPPDLLIVAYQRGLALDLGIGGIDDMETTIASIVLAECSAGNQGSLPDDLRRYIKSIAMSDGDSKLKKLIHKGLLKYLGDKEKESRAFIDEIVAAAGLKCKEPSSTLSDYQDLIDELVDDGDIMKAEYSWLLEQAMEQRQAKR